MFENFLVGTALGGKNSRTMLAKPYAVSMLFPFIRTRYTTQIGHWPTFFPNVFVILSVPPTSGRINGVDRFALIKHHNAPGLPDGVIRVGIDS
jgi:hypothetical protein